MIHQTDQLRKNNFVGIQYQWGMIPQNIKKTVFIVMHKLNFDAP